MDAAENSNNTKRHEDGHFPSLITEADVIIGASKDEIFVITCFQNHWLAAGGKDDQAVLYAIKNNANLKLNVYAHQFAVNDFEPVLKLDDHNDSVICAQFNGNGYLLATADMGGLIIITDTKQIKKCFLIDDCEELSWMQWHPSVDILFAGGKNGIWMWLVTTESVQQRKVYVCDSPSVSTVGKLLSDGKRLLSCYEDGIIKLWSLKDGKSINIVTRAQSATCMDVHHNLPIAIVGDLSSHCYLVSTDSAKLLRIFAVNENIETSEEAVECVKFCPSIESWFAVGTNYGRFAIYDFISGILRHTLMNTSDPVVNCFWHITDSNEMYIICASYNGTVKVWNGRSGIPFLAAVSQTIANKNSCLLSMDFVVKEPVFYTAYSSGQICKFSMSYQLYRSTTLGMALRSTLDEFVEDGTITPSLAQTVLVTFDKCINKALSQRVKNKVNFKADKLKAYRFCDNVWTFVMENVEFRDVSQPVDGIVDRVKIVACDASAAKLANA
ncbi:unnamed protein product [Thelazia callipaeda]|uniref:Transcription initiation factor IIA subunit 2 n=1 Tax=Thelazia callipaeda TaxID=103827 RepID=A0A0N5D4W6_THECL|nr:unnamed protein product [Thelazia callipaeda]